jgi:adenine deaminase
MCRCLEFSLLFPHFFTGLLIITTANGTTIVIKGNSNIATKLGKDGAEGIFFFIKQMGTTRATVFVFQKNYQNKMQYT